MPLVFVQLGMQCLRQAHAFPGNFSISLISVRWDAKAGHRKAICFCIFDVNKLYGYFITSQSGGHKYQPD